MAPLSKNFDIMRTSSGSDHSFSPCCATSKQHSPISPSRTAAPLRVLQQQCRSSLPIHLPVTTSSRTNTNTKKSSFAGDRSLTNTSQSCNKRVDFNGRVKIRKTLHVSDYSDEEMLACWFSHEESKRFRQDALFIAQLAKDGHISSSPENEDSPVHCLRGLEMYTGSNEAKRRQQRKAAVRWALLKEMDLQHEEGGCDANYIAELYNKASASCVAIARALALQDELSATL